jgi:hypothetical protein
VVRLANGFANRQQNAIEIAHYLLIAEPQDADAALFQQSPISLPIRYNIVRVPIHLDREFGSGTVEIDDPPADGLAGDEI